VTIITTALSVLDRGLFDISGAEIEQRNRKNDLGKALIDQRETEKNVADGQIGERKAEIDQTSPLSRISRPKNRHSVRNCLNVRASGLRPGKCGGEARQCAGEFIRVRTRNIFECRQPQA